MKTPSTTTPSEPGDVEAELGNVDPVTEETSGELTLEEPTSAVTADLSVDEAKAEAAPQSSPVPLAKQDCGQLETQQSMNQCAADNYKIADNQLNQVYQQVRSGLSAVGQEQLTDAEEQWITFRDAQCGFESNYFEGGSMAALIKASCMEQITDNRVAELQQPIQPGMSFASADEQLNRIYQSVQSIANETESEALTDVQLSWLDYRDAHCEYEANLPSGTDIETCLAAITETRVWQLQALRDGWSL
ncbi:MAG: lysozyme inhibitor LprI family protein [Cyanobacteria bacterium J06642_11]